MTGPATARHIQWHCALLASSEYCTLLEDDEGYRFHGVVVAPLALAPCHIDYLVTVDHEWRTRDVRASIVTPSTPREIRIQMIGAGVWNLDGHAVPFLDGCDDVDLGWTPATNTIPIRRLGLQIGESRSIDAAWIRFPELDVVRNEQQYTRLSHDRWRYATDDYEFELVIDPETGFILAYGDDLWQASAKSW